MTLIHGGRPQVFQKVVLEKHIAPWAKHLISFVRFMKRFKCDQALVISSDIERIEKIERLKVTILPYWRHWSIINEIKGTFVT